MDVHYRSRISVIASGAVARQTVHNCLWRKGTACKVTSVLFTVHECMCVSITPPVHTGNMSSLHFIKGRLEKEKESRFSYKPSATVEHKTFGHLLPEWDIKSVPAADLIRTG